MPIWGDAPDGRPLLMDETLTALVYRAWRASGRLLQLRLLSLIGGLHRDQGGAGAWPLSLRLGEWLQWERDLHEVLFLTAAPDDLTEPRKCPPGRPHPLGTRADAPAPPCGPPGAEFAPSVGGPVRRRAKRRWHPPALPASRPD